MGELADWNAQRMPCVAPSLSSAMAYEVNEGDGAFYGQSRFPFAGLPRQNLAVRHDPARFQLPERFELEYTGADGQKHRQS